jgi:chromosome segregation ATPase
MGIFDIIKLSKIKEDLKSLEAEKIIQAIDTVCDIVSENADKFCEVSEAVALHIAESEKVQDTMCKVISSVSDSIIRVRSNENLKLASERLRGAIHIALLKGEIKTMEDEILKKDYSESIKKMDELEEEMKGYYEKIKEINSEKSSIEKKRADQDPEDAESKWFNDISSDRLADLEKQSEIALLRISEHESMIEDVNERVQFLNMEMNLRGFSKSV